MHVRRPHRHPERAAALASTLCLALWTLGASALAGCATRGATLPLAWTPGSFEGWHQLPGGSWSWRGDVLVGRSPKSERRHGLFASDAIYGDFEAEVEFRVLSGDSGFYFRAEEVDKHVGVHGFQAEIDTTFETGGLYETGGRSWVVKPPKQRMQTLYQPGEWTKLRVVAKGRDVDVFVNGERTAELRQDPGRLEGRIALQLHGGQDMHVEYRDLRVRRLDCAR